eukprot:RCo032142
MALPMLPDILAAIFEYLALPDHLTVRSLSRCMRGLVDRRVAARWKLNVWVDEPGSITSEEPPKKKAFFPYSVFSAVCAVKFWDADADLILAALNQAHNLTILMIEQSSCSLAAICQFAETQAPWLQQNLQHLAVNNCAESFADHSGIAAIPRLFSGIASLNLRDNFLPCAAAAAFAASLTCLGTGGMKNLTRLDFSWNDLTDEGLRALCRASGGFPVLSVLRLASCGLQSQSLVELAKSSAFPVLTALDFSYNDVAH